MPESTLECFQLTWDSNDKVSFTNAITLVLSAYNLKMKCKVNFAHASHWHNIFIQYTK